jgi:hypothetical protein
VRVRRIDGRLHADAQLLGGGRPGEKQNKKARQESSFCEQKEAKKLYPFDGGSTGSAALSRKKFFCFFFFKKRRLFLPHRTAPWRA